MTSFDACAVVPVYEHERSVGGVVAGLRAAGLHCYLVDDGSGSNCAARLDAIAAGDPDVTLLRLARNSGKGAAVTAGLRAAASAGRTHAMQIDADGQHDAADIDRFLDEARKDPDALVCGRPVFDDDMPVARRYGRYLTHGMVWLNTLSLDIPDAMCGFRVYPLAPVLALLDEATLGSRMDFDVELMVRLHWRGVPMRWLDTRVVYPSDGVSHFRPWTDNFRITAMHTRLFFGMLARLPALLVRSSA
ncbi:MAG: glycosyltransferase family 2 protein [Steroidobacteraceae bacterium]